MFVLDRLTIKEHVIARTSAGFWSDQTRTIHEVYNSTPFVLNNGKYSIEVVDALAAELLGNCDLILYIPFLYTLFLYLLILL